MCVWPLACFEEFWGKRRGRSSERLRNPKSLPAPAYRDQHPPAPLASRPPCRTACFTGRCEVIFGTARELSSALPDFISKILFRPAEDNSGHNGDNSWPVRTPLQVKLAGPDCGWIPRPTRPCRSRTVHAVSWHKCRAHSSNPECAQPIGAL